MRYLAVFQKIGDTYSAYVPDVPYCLAAGPNLDQVKASIKEGLQIAVNSLRPDHIPFPTAFIEELVIDEND